jgi:hypothetical protein
MKNIFLLSLLSLTISCSQKQKEHDSPNDNDSAYKGFSAVKHNASITDLQGIWNVNELILSDETREYLLFSPDTDEYSYGNHIKLNPDQTFECFYTADCGNGCFTSSAGKYKIIDKNYICFYLETITKSGDCSENFQPNRDLGLFYYYKKDKVFYLLKSSGNLEQDKKNVHYRDLIIAKRGEIEKFYENRDRSNSFMFNWKPTEYTDETPIVAFCMAENKIKNYEFLYYDKGNSYSTKAIALVKVNGELRYVIYDTWGDPKVTLYNDTEIHKIDQFIHKIGTDKFLKVKSFKVKSRLRTTSLDKETITVSKKGNEIYKVVYEDYPKDTEHIGVFTLTVYYHNSVPLYIDFKNAFIGVENKRTDKTGLYILDWENNKAAVKVIEGSGNYVSIEWIKTKIDQITAEIEQQKIK